MAPERISALPFTPLRSPDKVLGSSTLPGTAYLTENGHRGNVSDHHP